MLEKIMQEILEMDYPSKEIGCELEDEGITDRYVAAAYGFAEAQERIGAVIQNHMGNDGWIPCSKGMPENEQEVEITYTWRSSDGRNYYDTARAFYTDGMLTTEDSSYNWEDIDNWDYCEEQDAAYIPEGWWECVAFGETFAPVDQEVIAWRHSTKPYRPRKTIGEDYKQHIMNRFVKTE